MSGGKGAFMKYLLTLLIRLVDRTAYAMWTWLSPRSSVFYVRGRFLYDNNRRRVILRGINLPLLDDWNFPGSDKLDELAQTGANAVRIQWYKNYNNPARPPESLPGISDLDAFLDKCRENSLIPIVELHDWTCQDFTEPVNMQLIELIDWWTRPDVVEVLKRHERYLIINLANELGRYRFRPRAQQATALDRFKNAYKEAITSIRDEGLRMPIMIDAPDCGQSINAFVSIGRELILHDRRRSLLLSVHAYWAGYDGTPEIAAAVRANLPIVFGEIANKQDESDQLGNIPCFYALDGTDPGIRMDGTTVAIKLATRPEFWGVVRTDPPNRALILAIRARLGTNNTPPTLFRYQNLLATHLPQHGIGWLAWAWYRDNCADRQMTPDGNFANLTTYGRDIVFNPIYGLTSGTFRAEKTNSLPGAPPPP